MNRNFFFRMILVTWLVFFFLLLVQGNIFSCVDKGRSFKFKVKFSKSICGQPLDGRLLLMISSDGTKEPRFQISDGPATQLIFGIDVEGLKPGETAVIDDNVFGYPVKSIALIPPGKYWVQALLHRYETFHRSDGHTVKLPMDRGEGQRGNISPVSGVRFFERFTDTILLSDPIETYDCGKALISSP